MFTCTCIRVPNMCHSCQYKPAGAIFVCKARKNCATMLILLKVMTQMYSHVYTYLAFLGVELSKILSNCVFYQCNSSNSTTRFCALLKFAICTPKNKSFMETPQSKFHTKVVNTQTSVIKLVWSCHLTSTLTPPPMGVQKWKWNVRNKLVKLR